MSAEAQRVSYGSGPQAKRRLRNYLLVPSFQLKYTAMVVGVTVIVASVLGLLAYDYSKGQTQMLTINKIEAKGNAIDESFIRDLERYSEDADRKVALRIVGGVILLAIALGFTGILVTHRLVGPVYRLKLCARQVRDGHLSLAVNGLRKGDELQDLFEAFREMVASLRTAQQRDISELDVAIERAREAGLTSEALSHLVATRDRMRAALE
ncbi:MAG TPA: HAMP domain-containing protein [Polyangiales bacterium]|nr:HAMP domain-containing protein [Polyangiales bacterium]